MYRMVQEIHALIFGDPRKVEELGLRGIVAKHERALRGTTRALAWFSVVMGGVVTAIILGYVKP